MKPYISPILLVFINMNLITHSLSIVAMLENSLLEYEILVIQNVIS